MAYNLLAALDGERFGATALAAAHADAARAGYTLRCVDGADDRLAAWIDEAFPASFWSSEIAAGGAWIAERNGTIAGFAGFGARGLRFRWLRRWRDREDVGIFGPYGMSAAERGRGAGAPLLTAAMCALFAGGSAFALIPAVSGSALVDLYTARTGAAIVDEFSYDVGRFRATILASGAGTNAANVLDGVRAGTTPLEIAAVIVNRSGAGVIEVARAAGVDVHVVPWDAARESRSEYDLRLIEAVARTAPQVVLLLGWMHVLPASFLACFPQTLNLHPAYLPLDPAADEVTVPDGTRIPALRGAHALRDALRAGLAWTGVSVHAVTAAADRGAILVRVPLRTAGATTEQALRERVRPIEFAAVAAAIRRWTFEQ